MRRILLALSLFVLALGCAVAPDSSPRRTAPQEETAETLPAPVVSHDPTKRAEELPPPLSEPHTLDQAGMEHLAKTDPVAFLERVIEKYDREIRSYRVTLEKQERVKDRLLGVEVVDCRFREKPFSVRMDWKKGGGRGARTCYVEGENNGKLLVMPKPPLDLLGAWSKDPIKDEEVKSSSRYPVTEFGIQIGSRRTLAAWKKAQARGDLKILFGGVKKLKELNGRPTWELKRVGYPAPEVDGITEETFYFDVENWLQIGSYLTGEDGKLIASYYFRDFEPNVEFPAETFTKAGLKKN